MDKRSWPWRKKSSEKILASNDSAESSPVHSTRHPDDHQAVMKVLADHTRLLSADEGTIQWQQSDEKVKQLNERLAIALLDASAKDELVKQHAKVAEEAVSGWEKAEAEAATLKQQLDSAIQQKLATEDRVSHLDGALKECMRQLRHVREEQEEKIHDATVKNTREWERVRSELEEKLVDMEQKYLERDAENKAISKSLEERAITISEIGEAHSRAEADLNVLQIRFESMAKERAALKYECTVLKKKLEIRNNEERDLSKRSTKSANRQLLEAARKVEGECQLRGLVHKKPPGPGQMKSESESPGNRIDSNRRRIGKGTGFLSEKPGDAGLNMSQEETSSVVKDVDVLLERLSAMEEETRRLKELLARRDSELQHARFMCARTASKLSSVEEQLESLPHAQGVTKTAGMSSLDKHVEAARSFTVSCEPSLASVSDDGNDDRADSWASALIAELAHFKKGKVAALHVPKIQPDNLKETEPPISLEHDGGAEKVSLHTLKEGGILIEQSLVQKDAELHAAHRLCDQVRTKLASAEKELATLQSQNAVTQLSLQSMQAQLNVIFRAQDNGGNLEIVLDQARAAMGIPQHGSLLEEEASSPATDVDFKSFAVGGPDLTSAICKLVEIMKDLVTNSCEFPVLPHMESGHDSIDTLIHKHTHDVPGLQWKNSELDAKIKAFIAASNLFLHGKADIVQFVGDLSSVLSNLVRAGPLRKDASSPHMTRKSFHWDKMSLAIGEAEELSDANSPISDTSNVDGSEKQSTKTVPHDENSIINITKELPLQEVTRIQEELRKVQAEKVALETHMRVEFQRFGGIEQELAQLTGNKLELENKLQVANKELDYLKTKLHRAEQAESNLRAELTSAKSSRQLMDEQLSSINASRAESESQLKVIVVDRSRLQDRLGVLEREILGKQEKNAELEAKCWELKEQLLRNSDSTCSKCGAVNIKGEQASKEQEIAANLAECQQTILILGKQLKSLTSSKGQMKAPYEQSADQPVSPGNSSSRQSPSGLHPEESGEISSLLEAHLETSVHKKSRRHQRGKKELIWEPRRDSSASDNLDSELVSLSKSGRPLLELFGDKTPAHEHYIQAVEQLPSSSDEEITSSKRMEPVLPPKRVVSSSSKPPLHRKKKSPRLFTGVDMSRSMDDATSDKHNSSFTRLFFSRAKRTHS